jgi:hypothetical protein
MLRRTLLHKGPQRNRNVVLDYGQLVVGRVARHVHVQQRLYFHAPRNVVAHYFTTAQESAFFARISVEFQTVLGDKMGGAQHVQDFEDCELGATVREGPGREIDATHCDRAIVIRTS